MGCDIHGFIDYTGFVTKEGKPWRNNAAELDINRSYDLFHVLAGVRSYPERHSVESFPTKGVPEHQSLRVERGLSRWEGDGHSYSYLTLEECRLAQRRLVQNHEEHGDDYGPSLDLNIVIAILQELEEAKTDPLFIFWFDN